MSKLFLFKLMPINLFKLFLNIFSDIKPFSNSKKKFNNSLQLVKQMNKDVILAKKGLKTKIVI